MPQHEYPHNLREISENEWEEITEERYYDLLGCVPPEWQEGYAFAVGEPLCHMTNGEAVHECCIEIDGQFYSKPFPVSQFNADAFKQEIALQDYKPNHSNKLPF